MGLRKRLAFPLAALLGAAVAVLPAAAASESPTIKAVNYGLYSHYWSPAEVDVGSGGAVTLGNPSAVKHGVEWRSGPETPSCSGVPVGTGEAASGTQWSGTCTFVKPGTYTFWCTVHGSAMAGTITVSPSGTTTTATVPGTTPTTTPAGGPAGTETTTSGSPGAPAPPASPLAGAAAAAVRVASGPRARYLSGSVDVSGAGAGGRLDVDLLARGASLARSGAGALVEVGRLVRASLPSGVVRFRVALDRRGLRALRSHRRLALTVVVRLTPVQGTAVAVRRSVLLRS